MKTSLPLYHEKETVGRPKVTERTFRPTGSGGLPRASHSLMLLRVK